MNAGVQKLLNLGASLSIGLGVGVYARLGRDRPSELPPPPIGERAVIAADPQPVELEPESPALPDQTWFHNLSAAEQRELTRLLSSYPRLSRPSSVQDAPRTE